MTYMYVKNFSGGVWPLPWKIHYDDTNHTINPGEFHFISKVGSCDVIDKAIERYQKLTFPLYDPATYSDSPATLTSLTIEVKTECNTKVPQLSMDETYSLSIDKEKDEALLSANEVWGALRGLETFSQLVFQPVRNKYRVRTASVKDGPRFPHRGTLIDTGRHYLSLSMILQHLDVMSQNKMNVLHWHIVDSEAFPYTSEKFPNMSLLGAYTRAHIYSIDDIRKIIDYARLRGIRVVPEFDTPDLLSHCYNTKGEINQLPNIIDPTLPANFEFLSEFFDEALSLFGDKFMHFGGDEVESDMQQCWENNPEVKKRMKDMGCANTNCLLNYYWRK
ncbi:Beta-hexosaminidase subunit beta [Trichostrongylus colubriformis]|uniref:beta-N-acetylhexosaminidase n=1 Tax=Trichostrongylus colubriformis TaxID=6319 RepID=A0AAN8GF15_TRICO